MYEATTLGFDLSSDPSFVPALVSSDPNRNGPGVISKTQTLHMRIYCPGPETAAPGYPADSPRINWNDLRKAEWELKLNGRDRYGKGNLASLGNGYYEATVDLVSLPTGPYEVKLKIEDNDGNRKEYKDDTVPASEIRIIDAPVTDQPSRPPTGAPSTIATTSPPTST